MFESRLITSTAGGVDVEFALIVLQDGRDPRSLLFETEASCFATSGDGWLHLTSGSSTHAPHVDLQVWDREPTRQVDSWEEFDELPLTARGGRLEILSRGVDLPSDGAFTVRVYAQGRTTDPCLDGPQVDCSERWLVQLWPVESPAQPLRLGPRRLMAENPWARAGSAWEKAVDWFLSGWGPVFHGREPYYDYWHRLLVLGRPAMRSELVGDEDECNQPAYSFGNATELGREYLQRDWRELDELAAHLGLPAVRTRDDALDLILGTGVWISSTDQNGVEWIQPNPNAPLRSEVLDMSPEQARYVRLDIGRHKSGMAARDIVNLVRWGSPEGTSTTVAALSLRLALSPSAVLGGLDLLDVENEIDVQPSIDDVTTHGRVNLRRRR